MTRSKRATDKRCPPPKTRLAGPNGTRSVVVGEAGSWRELGGIGATSGIFCQSMKLPRNGKAAPAPIFKIPSVMGNPETKKAPPVKRG